MKLLGGFTKKEKSWMWYDWANSAHSVVVVTILPVFYNSINELTGSSRMGMAIWGYTTTIAMLIIAISSPILGAFGDFKGYRKKLFTLFMLVGVVSCLFLAFTPFLAVDLPEQASKVGLMILILYVTSQIGFSGSGIYYDSSLPDVTTPERMDLVSSTGFGLGYIGGSTIPLLAFLVLNMAGVPMNICLSFAFGFTAIWWFVFSFPFLKNVEQISYTQRQKHAVRQAFTGLKQTFGQIVMSRYLLAFLIAYFFYIDGVNTIIHMSTSYGSTLGIDSSQMMLALLVVQILGFPFALIYGKLASKFGGRTMIGVAILMYMAISVYGFFVRDIWQFWLLAIMVATSQGGIQSLSRSLFGKLIPDKNRSGEFFGFYDIFGKFSAIMGPSLLALTSTIAANAIRKGQNIAADAAPEVLATINAQAAPYGVLSILLLFLIGGFIFFVVFPKELKKAKINL